VQDLIFQGIREDNSSMDNIESFQEVVFKTKSRWLITIFGLLVMIVGVGYIWGEIVYLFAGHPDNIPYNPVFEWMFENDIRLSKFQYRLICHFPFWIFFCVFNLFRSVNHVFFTNLIVRVEGVVYSDLVFRINVRWEDVERIEKSRHFFRATERIYLRKNEDIENMPCFLSRLRARGPEYIAIDSFGKSASRISASELVNQYMSKYDTVSLEYTDSA
jgi:hypothetical protein